MLDNLKDNLVPIPLPNNFQMYEFNPQEQVESAKLSTLNQYFIQNLAGQVAHQLINLMISKDLEDTKKQIAYLTGQFQILMYLLEVSAAAYAGQMLDKPIPTTSPE